MVLVRYFTQLFSNAGVLPYHYAFRVIRVLPYHLVCGVCSLFIYLLDSSRAESVPITMRPVSVIYLFICVFSKLFLKILSQLTLFDKFFSYCTGIILRRFLIWLVVYVAIWRQLTFSYKKCYAYSDATNYLLNTVVCVRE